ncbi:MULTISPECIES: hypothetical protein [unclassified Streptomyces]|uniref:hypothetical protein n=1 Tax=unclassified Streptomyces TaxID=2593676 RepID=UPI0005F8D34B|nr:MULTISPECIES: hypothetical protein [unclassified Streptomyces]KJY34362.1 hypothetical protein VR45_17260 [Streptomyces sp. NRRL S-495]KOV36081.1 hypothetical protein ADK60_07450 [Streptomyces sp. XY431]
MNRERSISGMLASVGVIGVLGGRVVAAATRPLPTLLRLAVLAACLVPLAAVLLFGADASGAGRPGRVRSR